LRPRFAVNLHRTEYRPRATERRNYDDSVVGIRLRTQGVGSRAAGFLERGAALQPGGSVEADLCPILA
jgi:hypothetical protein